jgi:hypothetical protein
MDTNRASLESDKDEATAKLTVLEEARMQLEQQLDFISKYGAASDRLTNDNPKFYKLQQREKKAMSQVRFISTEFHRVDTSVAACRITLQVRPIVLVY